MGFKLEFFVNGYLEVSHLRLMEKISPSCQGIACSLSFAPKTLFRPVKDWQSRRCQCVVSADTKQQVRQ